MRGGELSATSLVPDKSVRPAADKLMLFAAARKKKFSYNTTQEVSANLLT
jgi:hypothetical protein